MDNPPATADYASSPRASAPHVPSTLPNVGLGSVVEIRGMQFVVEALIGEGVYGQVFRATDITTRTVHALKVLKPRGRDTRSLRSEQTIYASLESRCAARHVNSPHRLPCLVAQATFQDGGAMLVTDLAPGVNGTEAFRGPRRNMSEQAFIRMLIMAVEPVADLHADDIIHGDLKAANMVLLFDDSTGECASLMVVDYGLSCATNYMDGNGKDLCHAFFPKPPRYFDPAFAVGVPNGFASDLYSVGICFKFYHEKQRSRLSPAINTYLAQLIILLTCKDFTLRPTALQTIAALQRIAYEPGQQFDISGINVTVAPRGYISRCLDRCVLAVTITSTGEAAVVKLLRRGGIHKHRAERELYSLKALKHNVGVPVLRASKVSRELHDMRLLVTSPGGHDATDLAIVTHIQGLPKSPKEHHRREQYCLAMAQAVQRVHAAPGRTALLNMDLRNFVLSATPQGPLDAEMSLTAVDFGHSISPKMQHERPELCKSGTFNVFRQDVYALAKVWARRFSMGEDPLVRRMMLPDSTQTPTMHQVVSELSARMGMRSHSP